MVRVCTYCEIEGKPAVMGEKPPLEDKSRTDGVCKAHRRLLSDPDGQRAWFERWQPALEEREKKLRSLLRSLQS